MTRNVDFPTFRNDFDAYASILITAFNNLWHIITNIHHKRRHNPTHRAPTIPRPIKTSRRQLVIEADRKQTLRI